MTARARSNSDQCRLHLLLEPLEDRTVLSGASGSWWAYPNPSTQAATTASPASSSQSPLDSATSAATAIVSRYSTATPVSQVGTKSDATPDPDAATYSVTPASSNSGSQSSSLSPNSQSLSNPLSSPSSTYSNGGNSSGSGAAANQSSGQTLTNAGSYNSGALTQPTAEPVGQYYAPNYYSREYQAIEQWNVTAQQLERGTGAATLQVMLGAGRAEETAPAESAPPSQPAAETAVAPAQPNTGGPSAATNARPGGAEFIPALHHSGVPPDWTAELVAAGNAASEAENPPNGTREVLAFADGKMRPPLPDSGSLWAGSVPLGLEALERSVDRFFARLEQSGRGLLTWPGVANIGAWLAAGTTATAFFELARRTARARLIAAVGCGARRTSRDDLDELLLYGPDET